MIVKVTAATLATWQPQMVEIETQITDGIPGLVFVGLADKTISESKERVVSALRSCAIKPRGRRTLVNLSPADIKKTGSSCDLAIAVSLLHVRYPTWPQPSRCLIVGELSLDGHVKPIKGLLNLLLAASKWGIERAIFPAAQIDQVALINGLTLHPIHHLQEYIQVAKNRSQLPTAPSAKWPTHLSSMTDWSDIRGQIVAKRALEICAAGGHHLFLVGPPGLGKSALVHKLPGLLPPLTPTEGIEVAQLHSLLTVNTPLDTQRPFRAPHHTMSTGRLLGGTPQNPLGEITLAHRGVLFLDECAEMSRTTLESLRQPLEDGWIQTTMHGQKQRLPAQFTLVAASNPCPCGYANAQFHACRCTPLAKQRYQQRLSGPLLDRFELFVSMDEDLSGKIGTPQSEVPLSTVRNRVIQAWEKQRHRYRQETWQQNGQVVAEKLGRYCQLSPAALHLLETVSQQLHLSARRYHKLMRVARTIADLAHQDDISEIHVAEALFFRQEKCFPFTAPASLPES